MYIYNSPISLSLETENAESGQRRSDYEVGYVSFLSSVTSERNSWLGTRTRTSKF